MEKGSPWGLPFFACGGKRGRSGEGRGKLSEESFPLPSPEPPPISFQRLLTGGEAARREFGSAEGEKWGHPEGGGSAFLGGRRQRCRLGWNVPFCRELSLPAWGYSGKLRKQGEDVRIFSARGGLFRLCYRNCLMLFSLKFQRDNRKNALAVAPANEKLDKKTVLSPYSGDETATYNRAIIYHQLASCFFRRNFPRSCGGIHDVP